MAGGTSGLCQKHVSGTARDAFPLAARPPLEMEAEPHTEENPLAPQPEPEPEPEATADGQAADDYEVFPFKDS